GRVGVDAGGGALDKGGGGANGVPMGGARLRPPRAMGAACFSGRRSLATHDFVFTSESVSEGHPDKVCDRISDAIVDTYLAAEPQARCGVETLATTNRVVLAGETRGPSAITKDMLIDVARHAVRDIGYEQEGVHC